MSTAENGLSAARTVLEWVSGERTEFARIFFVERDADLANLDEFIGQDDAVILPVDSNWTASSPQVVRYSGSMVDVGDELFIDDRGVELQDYLSAAFVEIVGPTAARFFDEAGWSAFMHDADLARRTGVFPTPLIDPRVVLADRQMFSLPNDQMTARSIRVDASGDIHLGMQGVHLGHVSDWQSALSSSTARESVVGGTVPSEVVARDMDANPWLGRFMRAAELTKMLRLDNGASRIDGFGWNCLEDDLADAEPLETDPFIIDTPEGVVLADVASRRRQLLSPATADIVAIVQSSSSLDRAVERVAASKNVNVQTSLRLCGEAVDLLNVNIGRKSASTFTDLTKSVR